MTRVMALQGHRFCGEPVSGAQLQLIAEVVAGYPQLSRLELARTLCELCNWYRPNGQLKSSECRLLLESLHEQSLIQLPALRQTRPRGPATRIPRTSPAETQAPMHGPLKQFQPIHLRRVTTPHDQTLWKERIDQHHYLGYRIPFGAHMRYLIESATHPSNPLGCIQFSSPAWRMKARDRWLGWNDAQRKSALQQIINNSRFLILPWVKIPNLASHVLSKAVQAVAQDWHTRYAIRPCLVETLVDLKRYSGHCYRAANWLDVGVTSGRGRQDRYHERHGQSPKQIFLYPIQANARNILCR